MPITHRGYCENCGNYFEGHKKQYCSVECRVEKTGKERAKIMQEKNILYNPAEFCTQELDSMYNRQKMTCQEIGLAYGGISHNTIRKILVSKGFHIRQKGQLVSIRLKGYERSKEFIQKHIDWLQTHPHPFLGRTHSPESVNKWRMSKEKKGWAWSETQKQKSSETWRRKFKYDAEYLKKRAEMMAIRPNKPETILINLLKEMGLPYHYTGDYKFWIEGKNPDFVNCNGQKKIIEVFGRYWHKEKEIIQRGFLFGQYGYDTLFLWDDEFKNIDEVKRKLLEFDQKPHLS
jgi:hypothetical protein